MLFEQGELQLKICDQPTVFVDTTLIKMLLNDKKTSL